MKKNIFKTLLVALLIVPCTLGLVACGKKDEEPQSATISSTYNETAIQSNLEEVAETQNGLYIKLNITGGSDTFAGGATCAYGQAGDLYYFEINNIESIYDVSDETKMVLYTRNSSDSSNKWSKIEYSYSNASTTKAKCKEMIDEKFGTISAQFSVYAQFKDFTMTKTSSTVAGRDCEKFVLDLSQYASILGPQLGSVLGEQTFHIDKETGACLKCEVSVSSQYINGTITFECLEFKTGYTITVPTADQINA